MTGDGAATRWWLVRHAPVSNRDGLIYGRSDPDADISDAAAMDALARSLPLGPVWVTTPLRRARQTLDALVARRGGRIEPVIEPDFVEQDFGAWEGRPSTGLWGAIPRHLWANPARIAPPGGETFDRVAARVGAAVDRLGARFAGRDIVVVAHAGTVRGVLAKALGGEAGRALGFSVDALSVSRFDRGGSGWRIRFVNRRPG